MGNKKKKDRFGKIRQLILRFGDEGKKMNSVIFKKARDKYHYGKSLQKVDFLSLGLNMLL